MNRIAAMARKEMRHILRDPRSLAVAILMPVAMVLVYGAVIDMELRELPVGVMDLDRSDLSRDLVREMTSSGFIVERTRLEARDEIEPLMRRGEIMAALVIPRGFAAAVMAGEASPVQVLIDGADAATASTAENYIQAAVGRVDARVRAAAGAPGPFYDVRGRVWFNPQLESADFVVPGLVALVLMMVCALLTSIAITREKETGTLEQILTTPVTPVQVVAGKVIPYVVLGAFDAFLVLLIGRLVFGVPMVGPIWAVAAYSLLFVIIALSFGLLISAAAPSLRVAMMAAILTTMLPTMILSGFMFPIRSMPPVLQAICQLMPPTHFLVVLRGVMLKGEVWYPVDGGVMILMALVLLTLAVRRFRLTLE